MFCGFYAWPIFGLVDQVKGTGLKTRRYNGWDGAGFLFILSAFMGQVLRSLGIYADIFPDDISGRCLECAARVA